jgi:hypothetical protein
MSITFFTPESQFIGHYISFKYASYTFFIVLLPAPLHLVRNNKLESIKLQTIVNWLVIYLYFEKYTFGNFRMWDK